MQEIEKLFGQYHFDGIIFGHALSGNVHFVITPILSDTNECARFDGFMQALVDLVRQYGGSIKSEHSTERMI